jgi:putative glutamine amidotransferase
LTPAAGPSPYRPLIAVAAYHLGPDRVTRWPGGGYGVPAPYIEALRRADARTAIVSPGETGSPEDLLEPFDGLLLVGGGDVDPTRYGQKPGRDLYGIEPDRDAFEIEMLLAADRAGMPALCICRGMQVMNVAYGGTLHQHLPGMSGLLEHGVPVAATQTVHDVTASPGSRLLGTVGIDVLACSSHHHQGIDRLGEGLMASGRSADGLVEAIERVVDDPDTGTWMLGVQWHPEDTAATDPAQEALFQALSVMAKYQGSRAKPGETHGRTRAYQLVESDPAWPAWFEQEAGAIRGALGDMVTRIDHIGSTSVPGLAAKPVIDVQVSVTSMIPREPYSAPLRALGYEHTIDPIDSQQEFFDKGYRNDGDRRVHIHVCETGTAWESRHLAFRDWLRSHPEDAAAYENLKRDLAERHPNDIHAYTDGKTAFIRSLEARGPAD